MTAHLIVAIGYWQFDDRPVAVRYNADRAHLQWLVDHVPAADRAAVAIADDTDPAAHAWTTYYLDRLSLEWPGGDPPAAARWAIQPADYPSPAGFAPAAAAGPVRLYRRVNQPTATNPTSVSVSGSGTAASVRLSRAKYAGVFMP